ncbi:hypothetical protein AMTR_s00020p00192900 [Amborella trichopoda]|uniref:Uncharacterized protein n=1 Tax=Amborella trichopoda TaxID=13333 RepID=W1PPD8_AMBTC|nr:hypothetical protein AMTR_s00020p00192900 [Amborella trichopoda]
MRNPAGNNTSEDAIIIADDEPPMAVVEEDPGHAFNVNSDEPSSLSPLPRSGGEIQLLDLLERTAVNLTSFGVPEASKLKKIMGELTQKTREILKLERLVSPTLNPFIGPLLDFYSDQPSIFGYAKGLQEKLKSDLTDWEDAADSPKEGEDAALGGISLCDNEADMIVLKHHIAKTEALLSQVHKEMSDLPLANLELGTFPLLARPAGSLKVVELKDRLGIRQRVVTKIGAHKVTCGNQDWCS